MRPLLLALLLAACASPEATVTLSTPAEAAALGQPAPAFSLPDLSGKTVSLKDYAGKTVILEWFNPGCPFIKYAHGEGPLKAIPKVWNEGNTATLLINSSAPGKQGHGVDTNKAAAAEWGITAPILIDESGATGKAYGAKTTPHMFVINAQGTLVYDGALDNAPLGRLEQGPLTSFVDLALADLGAGRAVGKASTQAYGCGVKYGS